MEPHRIGLDVAKVFVTIYGVDSEGKSVICKRASKRETFVYLSRLKPCLVGVEACGNAHFLAKELRNLGHDVRLVAPQLVALYRLNKDGGRNNASAICEAIARLPTKRPVALSGFFSRVRSLFSETYPASQAH